MKQVIMSGSGVPFVPIDDCSPSNVSGVDYKLTTDTNAVPLCSVYEVPSYELNFVLIFSQCEQINHHLVKKISAESVVRPSPVGPANQSSSSSKTTNSHY